MLKFCGVENESTEDYADYMNEFFCFNLTLYKFVIFLVVILFAFFLLMVSLMLF